MSQRSEAKNKNKRKKLFSKETDESVFSKDESKKAEQRDQLSEPTEKMRHVENSSTSFQKNLGTSRRRSSSTGGPKATAPVSIQRKRDAPGFPLSSTFPPQEHGLSGYDRRRSSNHIFGIDDNPQMSVTPVDVGQVQEFKPSGSVLTELTTRKPNPQERKQLTGYAEAVKLGSLPNRGAVASKKFLMCSEVSQTPISTKESMEPWNPFRFISPLIIARSTEEDDFLHAIERDDFDPCERAANRVGTAEHTNSPSRKINANFTAGITHKSKPSNTAPKPNPLPPFGTADTQLHIPLPSPLRPLFSERDPIPDWPTMNYGRNVLAPRIMSPNMSNNNNWYFQVRGQVPSSNLRDLAPSNEVSRWNTPPPRGFGEFQSISPHKPVGGRFTSPPESNQIPQDNKDAERFKRPDNLPPFPARGRPADQDMFAKHGAAAMPVPSMGPPPVETEDPFTETAGDDFQQVRHHPNACPDHSPPIHAMPIVILHPNHPNIFQVPPPSLQFQPRARMLSHMGFLVPHVEDTRFHRQAQEPGFLPAQPTVASGRSFAANRFANPARFPSPMLASGIPQPVAPLNKDAKPFVPSGMYTRVGTPGAMAGIRTNQRFEGRAESNVPFTMNNPNLNDRILNTNPEGGENAFRLSEKELRESYERAAAWCNDQSFDANDDIEMEEGE